MLTMSSQEILQTAIEVDALQKRLLAEFFLQNPEVKDFKLLGDFPKAGELRIEGELWTYRKHGLGYSFLSEHGRVIDAHNHFGKTSRVVDAHRLAEYLIALHGDLNEVVGLHSMLEIGLTKLEHQG